MFNHDDQQRYHVISDRYALDYKNKVTLFTNYRQCHWIQIFHYYNGQYLWESFMEKDEV